jgi:VIT1/CCC1 family predicted Fe2+/Mn2+ transporter
MSAAGNSNNMSGIESWHEEKQSAWLYRQLAACEPDQRVAALFAALARAADRQADQWSAGLDGAPPAFIPDGRVRLAAWLARRLGPRRVRHALAALKVRGLSVYDTGRTLAGHLMPTSVAQVGARHKGYGGGNLRAAVFGVNDGLVSNASLIMGVAGAGVATEAIVTTGVAGLLAGALSMAAGEYVSMRSQREMFEYQIALERAELDEYPDEEAEELALIYHARGMDLDHARDVSRELVKNPVAALDALAREELGLNPDDLGSPVGAAVFSFVAFALGAAVPLLPFFARGWITQPVIASAALAGLTLFGVGAALSLFTGREALRGGLRMVLIGCGAGIVTWLIGSALGAAVN